MDVHKAIFSAGAKWRNPELFNVAHKLQQTDFASKDEYRAIQAEKLERLFRFHKANSAYYRSILPDKFTNPHEVLAALPILTKSELHTHHNTMQCYKYCGKSFFAETSGTSGQPFSFRKDLVWDTAHRASIVRSYWWHGIEPWQRNGYFWGYSFSGPQRIKTMFLDELQNRFRVFSYKRDELESFLNKLKSAVYLHGYSSMIYEVALHAKELGFSAADFPELRMVKGTSEKIYDYYQEPVKSVFGKRLISEYGSAEGGIHAFECPQGNMHINEENVILEEVEGAAVITNLNAFSLPIYRYQIGDAIALDTETQCACGRKSGIVREVLGRVGKKIVGKQQSYPSLTLYYIFKNIAVVKGITIPYQAVQNEKGSLDLRVSRSLTDNEKEWIRIQCEDYFGTDLHVTLHENQLIHDKKGKLRDFISTIDGQ